MSYNGGAHKSINGTFTFLKQSVEKNIGTLNFHFTTTGNNTVFVVLSGNFTPAQRNIVKTRCSIDVKELNSTFSWIRNFRVIQKTELDINSEKSNSSTKLIHTVSAACKNVPYSDETAKEQEPNCFLCGIV